MDLLFWIIKNIQTMLTVLSEYQLSIAVVLTLIIACSVIFKIIIMKNNSKNVNNKTK